MGAVALGRDILCPFFGEIRYVAVVFSALMIGCVIAANANAQDAKPVKKVDPLLLEDTVHKLSISSYLQSFTRGSRSVPILVTLSIKGPKGLQSFCEFRPRVFEAVLSVVTNDQVATRNRKEVVSEVSAQVLEAVNDALPNAPVSSVEARMGRSASEFGKEIIHTTRTCKKLDS